MEGELLVNIVIDEMFIKEQLDYTKNDGFIEEVNIGIDQEFAKEHKDVIKANKVLVFMDVDINYAFKVPLAYFFTRSLSRKEMEIYLCMYGLSKKLM